MTHKVINAASRALATLAAQQAIVNRPRPLLRVYTSLWQGIIHINRTLALQRLMASSKTVKDFPLPLGSCPSTTTTF
jgi:hypothetical protein